MTAPSPSTTSPAATFSRTRSASPANRSSRYSRTVGRPVSGSRIRLGLSPSRTGSGALRTPVTIGQSAALDGSNPATWTR